MPRQDPPGGAGGTILGPGAGGGTGGAGSISGAGGARIVDGPLPSISALRIGAPDDFDGAVELRITVASGRADGVQAAVALSRRGSTFQPANLAAGGGAVVAADDPAVLIVRWRALDDLGFRPDPTAVLWVALDDGRGAGPSGTFPVPPFSNRHAAARRVDHYVANYGSWSAEEMADAAKYQLVIVHPGQGKLMRDAVATLQRGIDPDDTRDDALVLCYISVGEDLRTAYMPDAQLRTDPRFKGDGSGPRIDPRGWNADGMALTGIDPRGLPSNGGTGFASYYLDDNDVHNTANHAGDGLPDRNKIFGALFVNAGDPAWFTVLDQMTADGPDRLAGFRELLTPDYGRGLDCDGVFLDTIDTAAPNSYTNASSSNQSEFEWTAPGYETFIRRVHSAYPDRVILQNRGLFFFDPRRPQYRFNARGAIDLVLFESFRLNSSAEGINATHYADNRYNFAPKLMAEANRPDGFRVLSLGYAEGPDPANWHQTLLGASTAGLDSLLEDIRVTQELQGFRHYLTDGAVALVNDFVLAHASMEDRTPPRWTSTYNDHFVSPAVEATPRVGIQQAVSAGGGKITVRWDVALDMSGVRYALYASDAPFDFAADPTLSGARRFPLASGTRVPDAYLEGVGVGRFPYEATVAGFTAGKAQYLLIRAADGAEPANEETNQTVLTVTP